MSKVGVVVIGGGPAGLSAAIAASVDGASVLLVEREARLGGVLKQCIDNNYGDIRYGERISGPEYAFFDINNLEQTNTIVLLQTTVLNITSIGNTFQATLCNRHGIVYVETKSIVIATGCMERSPKQIAIHGSRPAGLMTAGSAQYYANIMGQLPAKRCLILGSGNIGMIMARRLTLDGAKVLGVYEPGQIPDGLLRNVVECLNDFNIPLHFGHTITHVTGTQRLRSAVVCRVDKNLNPLRGTENQIECDSVIVSAGLIPDIELSESLGVPIAADTNGPMCDQNNMSMIDGVFVCGNALHINDLVDYISESGEIAGRSAARYMQRDRQLVSIRPSKDFLYSVPQCLDLDMLRGDTVIYFRVNEMRENVAIKVIADGQEVFMQEFEILRPPEVQRIIVNFNTPLTTDSNIEIKMDQTRAKLKKSQEQDQGKAQGQAVNQDKAVNQDQTENQNQTENQDKAVNQNHAENQE